MTPVLQLLAWMGRYWLKSFGYVILAIFVLHLADRHRLLGLPQDSWIGFAFLGSIWAFFIPSRHNLLNLSWIRSLPMSRRALIGYLAASVGVSFLLAGLTLILNFILLAFLTEGAPGVKPTAVEAGTLGVSYSEIILWGVPFALLAGTGFLFSMVEIPQDRESRLQFKLQAKKNAWIFVVLYYGLNALVGPALGFFGAMAFGLFLYLQRQLKQGLQLPGSWARRADAFAGAVSALPIAFFVLFGSHLGKSASGLSLIELREDLGKLARRPGPQDYQQALSGVSTQRIPDLLSAFPEAIFSARTPRHPVSEAPGFPLTEVLTSEFLTSQAKNPKRLAVILSHARVDGFPTEQQLQLLELLKGARLTEVAQARLALEVITSPEMAVHWVQKTQNPTSLGIALVGAQTFAPHKGLAQAIHARLAEPSSEAVLSSELELLAFKVARILEGRKPRWTPQASSPSLLPTPPSETSPGRVPAAQAAPAPAVDTEPLRCGAANVDGWLSQSEVSRNLCARALAREKRHAWLLGELNRAGWLSAADFDRDLAKSVRAVANWKK
jgi:hypothetical protein